MGGTSQSSDVYGIISFVFAILDIYCGFIFEIVAIVCGIMGMKSAEIKD
ncbi:MAG: hypothetical protein ACTSRH_04495 [Promethearchaeota archaeon]